jgi:hypothetical protein
METMTKKQKTKNLFAVLGKFKLFATILILILMLQLKELEKEK